MKIFVVGFALLVAACVSASVEPSAEYLPPVQEIAEPVESSGVLADDGYRYKTVHRFRVRRRRSVNELPSVEYQLPIVEQLSIPHLSQFEIPSNEYLAPVGPSAQVAQLSSGVLADDGYRYKTVKRFRSRHRRSVNELPSVEYLPPVHEQLSIPQVSQFEIPSNEYLAPVGPSAQVAQISSGVLADDGYRYKTVKRFRSRHRRSVNELPSVEYLPPVHEQLSIPQVSQFEIPSNEYLAPVGPSAQVAQISSGVLADDGYRYKTVKRFRSRHRRSVNELPSVEYLPPVHEQLSIPQVSQFEIPSNEYLAPVGPSAQVAQISSGVLADDGYRYKTVKRFRSRHRRSVNELPSVEYLPPVHEQLSIPQVSQFEIPSNEYLAPVGPSAQVAQISSGVLADDGYRYKTVKRFRSRHRRSVNELPSVEYLPPVQQQFSIPQVSQISALSNQYLAPVEFAPITSNSLSGVLADDGYRYKTVRKIKRRL